MQAGRAAAVAKLAAACQLIPAEMLSTYPLVARAVEPVPAFDATTETTFNTPFEAMLATTVPLESLNSTKGAVAPVAALNTADSS